MSKSVSIIGGGLAGIATAVFLQDNGYNVTLFEATSKIGGRTFSYYDNESGLTIDNGQHIFAGWYENTFELFEKMNKSPDLMLSQNMHVFFKDKGGKEIEFLAKGDNPFVSVAKGFMNYAPLTFKDKIKLLRLRELIEIDFSERVLKGRNLSWLLDYLKQTDNLKKYFWEPFAYAVFNTSPEFVDAVIFYNVLAKAFENPSVNSLVIPNESLNELFAIPFVKYATDKIDIKLNSKVEQIDIADNVVKGLKMENGAYITSDFYVSSVPFYNYEKLFSPESFKKHFNGYKELKSASIVSVLLIPEKMPEIIKDKYYFGMVGIIDGFSQWVFFKDEYISVIISAPEYTVPGFENMSKEFICDKVENEIREYFTEFKDIKFKKIKYFREKRATFLPETNNTDSRLESKCSVNNLFISGDWTNTGLPSTIESAVISGRKCAELISNN
jgi:squalene-associated FAD-dependent desaturase